MSSDLKEEIDRALDDSMCNISGKGDSRFDCFHLGTLDNLTIYHATNFQTGLNRQKRQMACFFFFWTGQLFMKWQICRLVQIERSCRGQNKCD